MSEFLAAISRSPDDDGPRLVWADALEQEGDPRADYLRLEVEWFRARERLTQLEPEWETKHGHFWEAVLLTCGPMKINCIKALREVTYFGLRETKTMADLARPTSPERIHDGLTRREAEASRRWIHRVEGTRVEVVRSEQLPRSEVVVVENLWSQLLLKSDQLAPTHAGWMRAINRSVKSLWNERALPLEIDAQLASLLGPLSYAADFLSRSDRPEGGGVTLRQALSPAMATRAVELLKAAGEAPELRPSRAFFDWPAGC